MLQQVLDRYPKEVNLVYKHFPLPKNKFARKAATAALGANRQGRFWDLHHHLYENYRNLNDDKIQELAKALGLDMARFNNDFKDPALQRLIMRDVSNGEQEGVRSVPTVFVGGKRMKERSFQSFQQMIEAELKKRSGSTQ